jgi:hypothetical protein
VRPREPVCEALNEARRHALECRAVHGCADLQLPPQRHGVGVVVARHSLGAGDKRLHQAHAISTAAATSTSAAAGGTITIPRDTRSSPSWNARASPWRMNVLDICAYGSRENDAAHQHWQQPDQVLCHLHDPSRPSARGQVLRRLHVPLRGPPARP